MNVVLNFHKGDQSSARLLLELLMVVEEGIDCQYYLQYGDEPATLRISDTIFRFLSQKQAVFSNEFPAVSIPPELIHDDPNLIKYSGNHTRRTKAQKQKHLMWNLCVYKYIQTLDHFLLIEPDSVVLKDGWLLDIYDGWKAQDQPVFGHLKTGKIDGREVPTHWAGSSVYNSKLLRELGLEKYFYERYPNPWWPHRNNKDTETANNCFWGPAFSGYDISYDYFLFALYWKEKTGSNNPDDWPTDKIASRQDLIFCDFNTKMSAGEIFDRFKGKLPLMHGIKGDEIREKTTKHFAAGKNPPARTYPLSGPTSSPITDEILYNISDLKNKLQGERCFIIGNGPSLNKTDLALLKHEYTIGLNRIYLNFDKMGFEPTFCCVVNPHVIEQFGHEIDRVNSIKFIRKESQNHIKNHWNTFFVDSLSDKRGFNETLESLGWYEGWTVTYCAMQLAYFLGFKTVILVGVDHFFEKSGAPNKLVTADAQDPNHFHPNYFGPGVKWQYPDLARSEESYKIAKQVYARNDRTILDATIGGKLQVFRKVDYQSLLKKKAKTDSTPYMRVRKTLYPLKKFVKRQLQS
jgi:hypothetical protein